MDHRSSEGGVSGSNHGSDGELKKKLAKAGKKPKKHFRKPWGKKKKFSWRLWASPGEIEGLQM